MTSSYEKSTAGGSTTFHVTPASLGIYYGPAIFGLFPFILGLLLLMPGTGTPALLALVPLSVGGFFLWFGLADRRYAIHKTPSTFNVTPSAIVANGVTFAKEDIHRISAPRVDARWLSSSKELGLTYATYALDCEAGGKRYTLAGGMDKTTAYGLLQDVNKVIGLGDVTGGGYKASQVER
jgi:hypothetical protein